MEQDEDYYGFIQHNGYVMGVLGAFSAFTFGTICLIITSIPDPSVFYIQSSLMFISALFYTSMYLLGDSLTRSLYYCRKRSVFDRHDVFYNAGIFVLFYLFGLIVALIFLVWNLYVISAICTVIYVISGIAASKFIISPLLAQRRLDRPQKADQT